MYLNNIKINYRKRRKGPLETDRRKTTCGNIKININKNQINSKKITKIIENRGQISKIS